uniref:DDE-1 domain-containing protein n=1 Tax=Amphimedon queenslandica TaxID=400682 RepID=A0A1X7TY31_AMPQE
MCATGITLPPFIIFDRKSHNFQLMSGETPGTLLGSSTNGWIDQELFILRFCKLFLMTVPKVRPLLLIMDGHSLHYNPDFIRIAAKEQILIFVLPPNTTHLTQPLDKGCFGPLKSAWKAVCHEFYCKNPGRVVSRYDFSALFAEAWKRAMTQNNVTGGFKVTGIYAFNRNPLKVDCHGKQEGQSLLQETGLAYIPMYSADDEERRSCSNLSLEDEPPQLERSLSEGDL